MRLCRADEPVQGGEENAAGGVAERNDQNGENRPAAPQTGHPEVEHIGHTVLRPAEDKHHHAEEQGQVLSKLMRIALIPLDGDVDENVAEHTQKKTG